MEFNYQWVHPWIVAHAHTLLTWLGIGLIVLILTRIQFAILSRKAARAMSESVATTVAACVPEIAAAGRVDGMVPGHREGESSGGAAQRPDMLRQLGLQTVTAIDMRLRHLRDLGNLRVSDAALTSIPASAVADPLLVVAPQHTVEAMLAAQRVYDQHLRTLTARRSEAQTADDACRAVEEALRQVRQASAVITARFEQAHGQADQADLQRLLIQEYNALGGREAATLERQTAQREHAAKLEVSLRRVSEEAVQAYEAAAVAVIGRLRGAWGHEEAPDWLKDRVCGDGEPTASSRGDELDSHATR